MNLLTPSVGTTTPVVASDTFTLGDLLGSGFPGKEQTSAAASAFRLDESADGWQVFDGHGLVFGGADQLERAQWRVEVGPGVIGVYGSRPARLERSSERLNHEQRQITVGIMTRELKRQGPAHIDCHHDSCEALRRARREARVHQGPVCAGGCEHVSCARVRGFRRSRIVGFSAKSRARMVKTYASLDMRPVVAAATAVDVTLTLPGDWLTVAPTAKAAAAIIARWRERFFRTYGCRTVGVWKREFQDRRRMASIRGVEYDRDDSGKAPHWHATMALPNGETVEGFRAWVSEAWAAAVDHPDAEEYAKNLRAGTNVARTDQARLRDPKRFGIYFSKHGLFSGKDYQNEPPPEWGGAVGRYWGYWNLERVTTAQRVSSEDALWTARILRRHQHAQRYYVPTEKWRKVTTVDRETGEVGFRWTKRRTKVSPKRMPGHRGYAVVNNGPRFAVQVAAYLDQRGSSTSSEGVPAGSRAAGLP